MDSMICEVLPICRDAASVKRVLASEKVVIAQKFKPCTNQFVSHLTLMNKAKAWIRLFSLKVWVNKRADCVS